MNNYITLDGRRYKTAAKSWKPRPRKPMTARLTVHGSLDVTYGRASLAEWSGEILVDVTPPGPEWGTVGELRASLGKRAGLAFEDHYYPETPQYVVHVRGWEEDSLSPMWDGPSNVMRFQVALEGKDA